MKKIFFILIFNVYIFANITNLNGIYDITYGIFGKLAKANANIKVKENNYIIEVKIKPIGLAKKLSNNLRESYLSKGKVINGKFKPNEFIKISQTNDKKRTLTYIFDYKNKKIIKKIHQIKKVYDPFSLLQNSKKNYTIKTTKKEKILDFWTDEDILSLFFNIKDYIKHYKKGTKKRLKAVGASDKKKGRIDIVIPKEKKYKQIQKLLSNGTIFIVKIYNKLFLSKEGELYISLNKEGLCTKAMLKDLLFFGDVVGTLKKINK